MSHDDISPIPFPSSYEPKSSPTLKSVQHLSGRRVQLSTGTLYGALKRMMDQDWIARVDDPQPNLTGRERKAYVLTPLGRNILKLETSRLQQLLDAAHRHPLAEQA